MIKGIELTVDTTRSLYRLVKRGERYTNYHVRGVYATSTNDIVESVSVSSATYLHTSGIDNDMQTQNAKLAGYAVYGCGPEGYHVCGDELSYHTCIMLAALLNKLYNDKTIST